MSKKGMNRREFLRASGGVAVGAAAAASGVGGLVAIDSAWAKQLSVLREHEAKTLLTMTRQIFPHPSLADIYYAAVVKDLDAEAKSNKDTAEVIKHGVAELDNAMGVKWIELSDGYQLDVLKKMESSPLFQKVKGKAVVSLYNNKLVWRHFGYEGSSAEYGGYIDRGFDDLTWLPNPPESASPKVG